MDDIELKLPPLLGRVGVARSVVGSALRASGLGFSDRRLDDVRVAVSEACTNAMEAQLFGAPDRPSPIESPIVLRFHLNPDHMMVEVIDHGPGMASERLGRSREAPPTDPTEGYGLFLMETLSDGLEIDTGPAGTTTRMKFASRGVA